MSPAPTITEIVVAGEPEAWMAAGFAVAGGLVVVGTVPIRLVGPAADRKIVWALHGLASSELDGLPTTQAEETAALEGPAHPNGVTRLDHVAAFSPNLQRTVPALEAAGLELRRLREGPTAAGAERQAFFRLGEAILEVVEHPPGTPAAEDRDAPSGFWGLAFLTSDMDASAARLGPLLGEPRDAIQPGRRIATVRREAGLGLPVALLTA